MNSKLKILLKSLLMGSVVVLVTFLLTFTYKYLGLSDVNPGHFFSEITGVSTLSGWFIYGLVSAFISFSYLKFIRLSSVKCVFVNGFIWGVVFFITSEFIIAFTRVLFNAVKQPDIIEKTYTLIVLHLILGFVISTSNVLFQGRKAQVS